MNKQQTFQYGGLNQNSTCDIIKKFLLILAGEGNGKPLQYACLENPMDGRAW